MRSLLKRIISILKCGSLYKMCYSFTIFTDETFDKQECIPVGCVPSAAVAVSPEGGGCHSAQQTPPEQTPTQSRHPPGADTPPQSRHCPRSRHPPGADTPRSRQPPEQTTPPPPGAGTTPPAVDRHTPVNRTYGSI